MTALLLHLYTMAGSAALELLPHQPAAPAQQNKIWKTTEVELTIQRSHADVRQQRQRRRRMCTCTATARNGSRRRDLEMGVCVCCVARQPKCLTAPLAW